jgi:hypothetical protein
VSVRSFLLRNADDRRVLSNKEAAADFLSQDKNALI